MNPLARTLVLTLVLTGALVANPIPPKPSAADIARLLEIEVGKVGELPREEQSRRLGDKIGWLVAFEIEGAGSFRISLILAPAGVVLERHFDKIKNTPGQKYRRIERADGDIIHHTLAQENLTEVAYATTLLNHEEDWDLSLALSGDPTADESAFPIDVEAGGIEFVHRLESMLRGKQVGKEPAAAPEREPPAADQP